MVRRTKNREGWGRLVDRSLWRPSGKCKEADKVEVFASELDTVDGGSYILQHVSGSSSRSLYKRTSIKVV